MSVRACLVLAVAGLTTANLAASDLPQIKARGTLRVLVAADEAPDMFSFVPEGRPGLEREMLEAFGRVHDVRLEIVPVPRFGDIIPKLLNDEGDVIVGIIDTPSRRETIDFTAETLPARHVAVTWAPNAPIMTVDELRQARVGVIQGTSWADAAHEAGVPTANITPLADTPAVLDALRAGEIEATIMSVTDFALNQRAYGSLQGGVFLGKAGSAAWGVRKKDTALRAALNAYLQGLKRSQAWGYLAMKYFTPRSLTLMARARRD